MMVDRPFELLGKYQVGDPIGHGAFGKVYRALNVQTGDFIAIKQIEKAVIQPEHLPGILRECELLRTLNHPNIVTFIDSHETDEYLYYIMEYIEGGSISKAVKKFGPFPESLLAHYIAQVLKGLQYLHSQGVIHRDIKGENVLVTKQGTVKLVDFGSCTYQAMDKMLTVVGTPFWMAPEIIEMDGSARNTACDIWSLGCTIIELSTGFPPFWELGPMPAMFAMVNQDHPPLPPNISELLSEFLLLCFTKEISKRPTASQLLEHPWIAAALKKTEKMEFLPTSPNPENNNNEAIMKQLQMENENLRSTVKSLKQHMLKLIKDQKVMRANIENLETELAIASKINLQLSNQSVGSAEHSPEMRRRTGGSGIGAGLTQTPALPTMGSSSALDRMISPPSHGKPRSGSSTTKPLPVPPIGNGVLAPKPPPSKPFSGPLRTNSDGVALSLLPGNSSRNSTKISPRVMGEDDQFYTRLRSSSEPIPSPYIPSTASTNHHVDDDTLPPLPQPPSRTFLSPPSQSTGLHSPRSTPRTRCGSCTGCSEDGICHHRVSNLALSPSHTHSPPTPLRNETPAVASRNINNNNELQAKHYNYLTHPQSPPTSRLSATFQRDIRNTASTPNLPYPYDDPRGIAVSPPSASSTVTASPFSPSGTLTLKPGDKCRVRSSSNTWHRAVVDEISGTKSAFIVYKATGKREEVSLDNILTEEEGKKKKLEKEKGTFAKRKHVATIFGNK